jgi:hypothetical protein
MGDDDHNVSSAYFSAKQRLSFPEIAMSMQSLSRNDAAATSRLFLTQLTNLSCVEALIVIINSVSILQIYSASSYRNYLTGILR